MRALVGLAISIAVLGADATRASDAPAVYAHRGGADLAPENTLGAFRLAHATFPGVWLELDVQLAADDVLVVIHDAALERTTSCTGLVADHTSQQLAECDAAAAWAGWPTREPVPRLAEVLDEGRDAGWSLMIELKNIPGEPNFDPSGLEAASALLADVEASAFPPEQLLIQSFVPTSLDAIERARPDIATALLTTSQLPGAPPGAGFPALSGGAFASARGYEVSAPDHTAPDLTPQTVAAIQALGRRVVVWTVDEPAEIVRAIALGVDGIISDRPDLVFDLL